MESPKCPQSNTRIDTLDSIRGIASLIVLLGHILGSFKWNRNYISFPILHSIFDGRSAVTMFFVLSGFVLTLQQFIYPTKKLLLIPFYFKRIARIWLPWFAIFIVSAVAANYFRAVLPATKPETSDWLLSFWSHELRVTDIIRQLLFNLNSSEKNLIPQDWSLGIELKASLLIPAFLVLSRTNWILLLACGILLSYNPTPSSYYYYTSFVIGVLAAQFYTSNISKKKSGLIWVITGITLYQIRYISDNTTTFNSHLREVNIWNISSVACALLIIGSLKSQGASRILSHRCFIFLGKVSYSLYLIQMIIIICISPLVVHYSNKVGITQQTIVQAIVFIMTTTLCLLASNYTYKHVEIPCIALGKRIATQLSTNQTIAKLRI